jgi:hypothetical protein
MADVDWKCRCGTVRGRVAELAPDTANRCICYCHDCRAFVHWLGRDDLLDPHGGVDIVQVARARLTITEGRDRLRCLRLTPKGLHRWYVDCCKTPVANTMPRVPFAGISSSALDDRGRALLPDPDLIHGKSAVGGVPPGASSTLSLRAIARPGKLFASWLARGLGQPSPLFDRSERPTVEPRILSPAERDELRRHPRA